MYEVLSVRQPGLGLMLENVFDPHNIAAVMRTCDSVGVGTIHTLYTEPPPHHLTGFRSSAGTWKWVEKIEYHETHAAIAAIKKSYGRVFAANISPKAIPVFAFDFKHPVALVFGNEQKGCSEELLSLCDGELFIPQVGMVQSLNISVACAVMLYEAYRQKYEAGHYSTQQLGESEILAMFEKWTDPLIIREQKLKKP
jgi:tRNA (guanosine-2'-O-)-methyltransferase